MQNKMSREEEIVKMFEGTEINTLSDLKRAYLLQINITLARLVDILEKAFTEEE